MVEEAEAGGGRAGQREGMEGEGTGLREGEGERDEGAAFLRKVEMPAGTRAVPLPHFFPSDVSRPSATREPPNRHRPAAGNRSTGNRSSGIKLDVAFPAKSIVIRAWTF